MGTRESFFEMMDSSPESDWEEIVSRYLKVLKHKGYSDKDARDQLRLWLPAFEDYRNHPSTYDSEYRYRIELDPWESVQEDDDGVESNDLYWIGRK